MHAFEIAELVAANQSHEHVYAEVLRAGTLIVVGIGAVHRFHDIEEDMVFLVFWAPPRHSRRISSSS